MGKLVNMAKDKGGVGGTLNTVLLAGMLWERGIEVSLAEVDEKRKLSQTLPGSVLVSMDTGATLGKVLKDKKSVVEHYDPLLKLMLGSKVAVVDHGQAAWRNVAEWASMSDVPTELGENGVKAITVAVAAPDPVGVTGAHDALVLGYETYGGGECEASFYLVLNEREDDGKGFSAYEGSQAFEDFRRLERDAGLTLIRVPHCDSRVFKEFCVPNFLPPMQGYALAKLHLSGAEAPDEATAKSLGDLKAWVAANRIEDIALRREAKTLSKWMKDVEKAFAPLLADILDGEA